jgi:hypothetical protein
LIVAFSSMASAQCCCPCTSAFSSTPQAPVQILPQHLGSPTTYSNSFAETVQHPVFIPQQYSYAPLAQTSFRPNYTIRVCAKCAGGYYIRSGTSSESPGAAYREACRLAQVSCRIRLTSCTAISSGDSCPPRTEAIAYAQPYVEQSTGYYLQNQYVDQTQFLPLNSCTCDKRNGNFCSVRFQQCFSGFQPVCSETRTGGCTCRCR